MDEKYMALQKFVQNDCIPSEVIFDREMDDIESRTGSRWTEIPPVLTKLKAKARSMGLWNLFMPKVKNFDVKRAAYSQHYLTQEQSIVPTELCAFHVRTTGMAPKQNVYKYHRTGHELYTSLIQSIGLFGSPS